METKRAYRKRAYRIRKYARPVRVTRPIAQNEIRMVIEKIAQVRETGGNSWVTMWNGNVVTSTGNNVTYIDQPEYLAIAKNFRFCRVTSMSMEVSLVASIQDGQYLLGAQLCGGDGSNFPTTVPGEDDMSALQTKKIVTPGQVTKLWYNCNRDNNQALLSDIPTDNVLGARYAQVISLGIYS